jgi:hypothetical protein
MSLDFYSERTLKAKKQHTCMLCRDEIIIGETYSRQSGKYYGEFFDRCMHIHCNNMVKTYVYEQGEDEFDEEGVINFIQETHCLYCEEVDNCDKAQLTCLKIISLYE